MQKALVDFLQKTLQMLKSRSTSAEKGEGGVTERHTHTQKNVYDADL